MTYLTRAVRRNGEPVLDLQPLCDVAVQPDAMRERAQDSASA